MTINKLDTYTIILTNSNHVNIGRLSNVEELVVKQNMNAADEASFTVYLGLEEEDSNEPLWDDIVDFKYIYIKELNEYFQISVKIIDSANTCKAITATSACECELSQNMLYDLEINTEAEIEVTSYKPSILYNPEDPAHSILNRALSKMPAYTIGHVDSSIAHIQRTFSVNETSIYDFFTNTIAPEYDCLFLFDSVDRVISVYDLKTVCRDCGNRGDFEDECPECHSKNLQTFGTDTTIYIDKTNLTDEIDFEADTGSVKNCFRLEAGDDDMTAAVAAYNPNGSLYIYKFTDDMKVDMSNELIARLEGYEKLVDSCRETYTNVTESIYSVMSQISYYTSEMMPGYDDVDSDEKEEYSAQKECSYLSAENLSPMALSKVNNSTSVQTVQSSLKTYAKLFYNSGKYSITVNTSSFTVIETGRAQWIGSFTLTRYSNEEDTYSTPNITININDDYEEFIKQKIKKRIATTSDQNAKAGILGLVNIDNFDVFKETLKQYCLNRLNSFVDAFQTAIDIMVEEQMANSDSDFHDSLYQPYYDKLQACKEEAEKRKYSIDTMKATETKLKGTRDQIQKSLNFSEYLGEDLYKEFCYHLRMNKYSNSNYISDGLTDLQMIEKAKEFLTVANNELDKACTPVYTITSPNLSNLLAIPEFAPLTQSFKLGSWIHMRIDGKLYRLMLITYSLSFSDFSTLNVEFANITRTKSIASEVQSVIKQASSMASSYDTVSKQTKNNSDEIKSVASITENGLDATKAKIVNSADDQTMVFDQHGMLFRKLSDESIDNNTAEYDPCQMKLLNNGLYLTDDNWKTINSALGKYIYTDPETQKPVTAYGLIAKRIVGEMIVGENLKIYTNDGSFSMDENGAKIAMHSVDGLQNEIDNSIHSVITWYYVSTSDSKLENGTWSTEAPPSYVTGYVWTKVITSTRDGHTTETDPICSSSIMTSGLSIGGTNLLMQSEPSEANKETWTGKSKMSAVIEDDRMTYKIVDDDGTGVSNTTNNKDIYNLHANQPYTYSFWCKCSTDRDISQESIMGFDCVNYNDVLNPNHHEINLQYNPTSIKADTWTLLSCTFNVDEDAYFCPYFNGIDDCILYVYGMKLENGNRPTDWQPAPEDTNTLLSKSYYTKSEIDSQFSVTKEQISADVSSNFLTKEESQNIQTLYDTYAYARFDSNGNMKPFCKLCSLTVNATNIQSDVVIGANQSNVGYSQCFIKFETSEESDPQLKSFIANGEMNWYIAKSQPGIWNIYIQKHSDYDKIVVNEYYNCLSDGTNTGNAGITVDWLCENSDGEPSSWKQRTKTEGFENLSLYYTSEATDVKLQNYTTKEELSSSIEQTSKSITSSVEKTYTTKTEFGSMQIGGTNLLKGSRDLSTSDWVFGSYLTDPDGTILQTIVGTSSQAALVDLITM